MDELTMIRGNLFLQCAPTNPGIEMNTLTIPKKMANPTPDPALSRDRGIEG